MISFRCLWTTWNTIWSNTGYLLTSPLEGDKVSMFTHTYPHKPPRNIKVTTCNHQADFMCGLMSCLVVCKFRKSMVIHDTECPYWDEVSLNNTNHTSRPYSSLLWVHDLGGWKLIQFSSTWAVPITSTTFSHHHNVPISALSSLTAGHLYWNITVRVLTSDLKIVTSKSDLWPEPQGAICLLQKACW